ncbi:hypothetical protein GCM10023339_13860 [Alloalcanivorax gelatiniphagus]
MSNKKKVPHISTGTSSCSYYGNYGTAATITATVVIKIVQEDSQKREV